MFKSEKWPLLGLIGCILLFYPLFMNTFSGIYSGDESLLFFVVSHPIWHRSFWESTGSMIAGMPFFFVENWFWIRIVRFFLGNPELSHHLELYGRLPLLYYFALTAASSFYCLKWLSRSTAFALLLTVGVFFVGPLAQSNLTEYRIHPCGLAYHMASWAGFTWFIANRKHDFRVWFFASCLAPWAHVFAFYGVALQLLIFYWLRVRKEQDVELNLTPTFYSKAAIKTSLLIAANLTVAVYFFTRYMQKGASTSSVPFFSVFSQGLNYFSNWLLFPSFFFWFGSMGILAYFLKSSRTTLKPVFLKKQLLPTLFVLSQWLGGVLFCTHFLSSNYRALDVMPRYVTLTLPPLIFGMGLLLRSLMKERKTEPFILTALSILISWGAVAVHTVKFYVEPPAQQTHPFKILQSQILSLGLDQKIKLVSGIIPNDDHSLINHVSGGFWGHQWQVYVKGALEIASIREYTHSRWGGLRGVSCEQARGLAPYDRGPINADSVILADLCDLKKFRLRVAPKDIDTQL